MIMQFQREELRDWQKENIIRNAKLCSHNYGFVIHEYRALASTITSEDFSKYDERCFSPRPRGGIKSRSRKNESDEIVIIPNPNDGNFSVYSSTKTIDEFLLIDINGKIVFQEKCSSNDLRIENNDFISGIYLVKLKFKDNTSTVTKIVIH